MSAGDTPGATVPTEATTVVPDIVTTIANNVTTAMTDADSEGGGVLHTVKSYVKDKASYDALLISSLVMALLCLGLALSNICLCWKAKKGGEQQEDKHEDPEDPPIKAPKKKRAKNEKKKKPKREKGRKNKKATK